MKTRVGRTSQPLWQPSLDSEAVRLNALFSRSLSHEPNRKCTCFFIVVLLHVVSVGGNSLKLAGVLGASNSLPLGEREREILCTDGPQRIQHLHRRWQRRLVSRVHSFSPVISNANGTFRFVSSRCRLK